ncbi:uncharacterized protein LOC125239301 [Leguminivora glycinivorella]|uniref:uncharacterized protein LOC125239301 n=1 Tax=Leguminivora glycinivorella TaxID=1035111 RepID=UPI00200D311F|nr:uncharacterized protein LOC125239301 [Leguminivora glycinivorella]
MKHSPPAQKSHGKVVDTDPYETNQTIKSLSTMNPDSITIAHLCYAISYMWRRASKGLHRYFRLRDTYVNHMPFEIGYITQTIMAKYQNVLELYQLVMRLEPQKKMGRPHLFFFYKNILEDCRTIIHLSNMIHEVTRKYRLLQYSNREPKSEWLLVPYDPSAKFQEPAGIDYPSTYKPEMNLDTRPTRALERGIEGMDHQKVHHGDAKILDRMNYVNSLVEKAKKREYEAVKKQKNYFLDHGVFSLTNSPPTRRTKRWRSNEPNIYGWEPIRLY